MELALLTDAYIMISVYDSTEKRVTTFQSHEIDPVFSEITVTAHERFRPNDVSVLVDGYIRKSISILFLANKLAKVSNNNYLI